MIPTVESSGSNGAVLAVAILAFLVLDLVVTAWVARVMTGEASGESTRGRAFDGDSAALIDRDERVVQCPHCDERNELGYRFCRRCVNQLPGGATVTRPSGAPIDRFTP